MVIFSIHFKRLNIFKPHQLEITANVSFLNFFISFFVSFFVSFFLFFLQNYLFSRLELIFGSHFRPGHHPGQTLLVINLYTLLTIVQSGVKILFSFRIFSNVEQKKSLAVFWKVRAY